MATRNLYSRIVAWLKILLPLAALAILSSLVFFARESDGTREIPFLTEGGPDTPGERLSGSEYQAMTPAGAAIRIRAAEIAPQRDDPGLLDAVGLTARLETRSGRVIDAAAATGWIDIKADLTELQGAVTVDTSDGFRVTAQGLSTRLDTGAVQSLGRVDGSAPFGTLAAGHMAFRPSGTGDAGLHFTRGVKVVYTPRN